MWYQEDEGRRSSETARVGRIVSDLLAFSRRSKPQRAAADLNRIVQSTLSLVQHKMKLSNVSVETRLRESLPAVDCDAPQVQQVQQARQQVARQQKALLRQQGQ